MCVSVYDTEVLKYSCVYHLKALTSLSLFQLGGNMKE